MKLHVGCGKRILSTFSHLDIEARPHIDFVTSADNLTMIPDSSCELIYTSHTLEYFDFHSLPKVLKGFSRILTPGGNLYVTVPDFDSLIRIYSQTLDIESIIGPLFGRWFNPSHQNEAIYHKCVFTEKKLTQLLYDNNFTNIKKFDPVKFLTDIDPNYDDYSLAYFPHLDRNGIQVSLALSAVNDP